MGYTTYFSGEIEVEPPLSAALVAEITAFNRGEYQEADMSVCNPGGYCQWVASDDGSQILWDDGEKFYDSPIWMEYMKEAVPREQDRAFRMRGDIEWVQIEESTGRRLESGGRSYPFLRGTAPESTGAVAGQVSIEDITTEL